MVEYDGLLREEGLGGGRPKIATGREKLGDSVE